MTALTSLKDTWRDLGARERRMVVIGSVALLVTLIYFMVWSPFLERVDNARQRVAAGLDSLQWMQSKAAEARTLQASLGGPGRSGLTLSGSFLSFVEESAKKGGLGGGLKGAEPSGNDQVLIRFEQTPFHALIAWMIDLHSKGVEAFSVALEREQEPGKVRARLVLGRSGG
ncbi:MAG: type II secretory pathway, component PulM [Magnetococcales bacterium]|nr:type II secretory pathway, component PulM [Magnetococcales bacterium]HIJ84057.1 type II secretion system protein M [Magnetococcales bacterium]